LTRIRDDAGASACSPVRHYDRGGSTCREPPQRYLNDVRNRPREITAVIGASQRQELRLIRGDVQFTMAWRPLGRVKPLSCA